MNIRLGIYEIFSRIVPGGVYMAAIILLLNTGGLLPVDLWTTLSDPKLERLWLIILLGIVVAAYVVGGALNPLSFLMLRIFKLKGVSAQTLAAFKHKRQRHWEIDLEDRDWPVLLAYLRVKNLELAADIERQNAISIMLRNVSMGLGLIGFNFLVEFLQAHLTLDIVLAVITFMLSALSLREAVKFRRWFYEAIFDTILAYRIDLEKIIKPRYSGVKSKHSEDDKQEM